MKNTILHKLLLLLVFTAIPLTTAAQTTSPGKGLSTKQIDAVVDRTQKTFNVPGMAVAVVKDGQIVHSKGYGIRSVDEPDKVDENTLFGVASNTKAVTAAALAQLVDQGEMEWDTKVVDVIPEFKLYNHYVTGEFTVRDLLTHRSGLGLGAGDLMVFPASNVTQTQELIHNLRYLKPVSSFRSKYDYDNLLYIVAGEVVARLSGKSYEEYVQENILRPLGMNSTAMSWHEIEDYSNVIDGHAPVDGELVTVGLSFTESANAAAGIYSSVSDWTKWVQVQLNDGKYGDNLENELFSERQHREMWTPQTLIRTGKGNYNTHFMAYGLGWNLSDVNGYLQVTHTGGLLGIVSQVTMIPELDLGIIVLTNQQSGYAFNSVTNSIKDAYFAIKGKDRIKQYNDSRLKAQERGEKVKSEVWAKVEAQQNAGGIEVDLADYAGDYKDPWFGEVKISQKDGALRFVSANVSDLAGQMSYYNGNTFIVKWDDRTLMADAFVIFTLDKEGKANGFTMEAVSPLTDFSFDFQDLDFKRAE